LRISWAEKERKEKVRATRKERDMKTIMMKAA
jgi:hypothetical protein